jgi:hypothetical protein
MDRMDDYQRQAFDSVQQTVATLSGEMDKAQARLQQLGAEEPAGADAGLRI